MVVVGAVLSSVYFELVHNLFEAIFLVWVGGGRWQYPQKEFQEWNGMESFLIRGIGARWGCITGFNSKASNIHNSKTSSLNT